METDASSSAVNSPTLTFVATQAGVILGTAAYMSPEQAKGAWRTSAACGRSAACSTRCSREAGLRGEDVSDTLAAVLRA
jgi:hypothetical protein